MSHATRPRANGASATSTHLTLYTHSGLRYKPHQRKIFGTVEDLHAVTPSFGKDKAEIASLSSVRGIAAWWVVLYHASDLPYYSVLGPSAHTWMSQGYLAVDLFFILSGFIIAKSYSSQFQEFSLRKYATFLWLRLARIYPLHLFMLVLYLSVPAAILAFSSQSNINGRFSADYYVLSLALIQNWGFTSDLDWNVPAWSISTEWLAYILFPLLLAVTGFVARVRLLGVLVPLLLLAVTVAFASNGDFGWNIPRYGATRCVLEFWAGICLFQITPAASSRLSRTTAALAFAALCTAYAGLDLSAYPVMPAAFLCLVFALSRDDGVISGALANPALHWLGKISYSTYLVHVFLREWVKFTLVRDGIPPALAFSVYIAAALIGSALLYRWIEVPGRTALRKLIAAPAPRSDAAPPQAANGRTEPTRSA